MYYSMFSVFFPAICKLQVISPLGMRLELNRYLSILLILLKQVLILLTFITQQFFAHIFPDLIYDWCSSYTTF